MCSQGGCLHGAAQRLQDTRARLRQQGGWKPSHHCWKVRNWICSKRSWQTELEVAQLRICEPRGHFFYCRYDEINHIFKSGIIEVIWVIPSGRVCRNADFWKVVVKGLKRLRESSSYAWWFDCGKALKPSQTLPGACPNICESDWHSYVDLMDLFRLFQAHSPSPGSRPHCSFCEPRQYVTGSLFMLALQSYFPGLA